MENALSKTRVYFVLRLSFLLLLGLSLLSTAAFGQGGAATLLGMVTDKSGAAVPNVKITITNMDNGFVRYAESNSTGNYSAPNLPIGRYKLEAEAQGFKTYQESNITLNVNATVRTNVLLEVGAVKESVTVEANALQVQSDTNEVSQTVTDTLVSQLATNGRNVLQLTALVPGAASMMPDFDVPVAQYQNRSVNFNGQRNDHNNWIIDGGEAYDRGGGGILIVAPSQDMIQEFKVTTSNFSADLGQSSGGMITMAMKQGTKNYHGSLWEYVRNDALNSYSWNAKNRTDPQNAKKNKLRYNTWGFNFGGPMNPKASNPKTFFFYNMEWRRYINGGTSNNRALTAAQRDGANGFYDLTSLLGTCEDKVTKAKNPCTFHVPNTLSQTEIDRYAAAGLKPGQVFDGNKIPVALVNSNAKAFLATGLFPLANAVSNGNPVYLMNADQRDVYREEAVRIDRQFSDKWTVMGHLIWDNGTENRATPIWSGMTYPIVGTAAKVPSWSGVVHATHSISPTLLNEISFNTNGNNLNIDPTGNYKIPSGWTAKQLFSDVNVQNKLPGINVQQGPSGQFGMNYDIGRWPWNNTWRSYQFRDDLSWSHGRHNIRVGGGWMFFKKMQLTGVNVGGGYTIDGSATGLGFADFLLGYANDYTQPQVRNGVNIAANTISLYAMDDWKVNNRLTLNLGLRWEGLPPAYDQNKNLSNFYPSLYDPSKAATFVNDNALDPAGPGFTTVSGVALSNVKFYTNGIGLSGRGTTPKGMVDNTWKTFAPRVGFAYDLTGKGTVLRGGFGMFYERTAGNEQYNMMDNVPFSNNPHVANILLSTPTISYLDGSSASSAYPVSGITGAALKHDVPTTLQFNLGIQHDINGKAVLNVAYVGNTAYHQTDTIPINDLAENDTVHRLGVCGDPCKATKIGSNAYRPYKGWGQINLVENAANSHYNSLQVSMRSSSWKNLTLSGTWTYAHGFDLVDGELWNNLDNPFNKNYNYATSGFDRRHVVNLAYVYNLPFFRNSASHLAKTVLGGWTISGVTLFSSGTPLTVNNQLDNLGYGGNTTNHADLVAPVSYPKTKDAWFSKASFKQATTPLAWGTSPRSSVVGPGRNNWNISLFKNFQFGEKAGFEFKAESFNTFNHTQWNTVETNITNNNFGKITGANDPRIFQLGARLTF